ncbi:hypothetical protein M569_08160 [Genlisea aurea]|uniref:Uncharacterized protein n=1 Tax=Genlisea aurea TaxID=192259 RepID=S8E2W3_9LAMI|nr:hypothetical protein M569_08160 [Genlisea aurea]
MSMSIFSSFEVLLAESAGVKVGQAQRPRKSEKEDGACRKNEPRRNRNLRFAPEIDGVYCFETILPC